MIWKVPYVDYPSPYAKIREEILEIIDQTLSRRDVMLRQQLESFETNFASFIG